MKNKILNIVLALTVVIAGVAVFSNTANAEEVPVAWGVEYTKEGKVVSHFSDAYPNGTKEALKDLMPGDKLTYTVTYTNNTTEAANFYVNAGVAKNFEDATGAKGGAYSYVITNTKSDGSSLVLFDSETVGGDNDQTIGLNQVDKGEDSYFTLGSVPAGKSGVVKVTVKLDGNTINNAYMETVMNEITKKAETGQLDVRFGAEPTSVAEYVTPHIIRNQKTIVNRVIKTLDNGTQVVVIDDNDVPLAGPRTGDSILPLVMCGLSLILGLFLIACYFMMTKDSRREEA